LTTSGAAPPARIPADRVCASREGGASFLILFFVLPSRVTRLFGGLCSKVEVCQPNARYAQSRNNNESFCDIDYTRSPGFSRSDLLNVFAHRAVITVPIPAKPSRSWVISAELPRAYPALYARQAPQPSRSLPSLCPLLSLLAHSPPRDSFARLPVRRVWPVAHNASSEASTGPRGPISRSRRLCCRQTAVSEAQ
jgi:hypothetical protein